MNIRDNCNPTTEEVRYWGYHPELYFIEQDEDLILHRPEYILILIELAADADCPKRTFCEAILEYYIQQQLLYRKMTVLQQILKKLKGLHIENLSPWLQNWLINLKRNFELLKSPRTMTTLESEQLARALTLGDYCRRDFRQSRTLANGFIEFLASTSSYRLYFYINPANGLWKISSSRPLKNFD